jgi:hypothetical protein
MRNAARNGLAKGMEQGLVKGKIDIARNIKKMGLGADATAQATGLPVADIETLD